MLWDTSEVQRSSQTHQAASLRIEITQDSDLIVLTKLRNCTVALFILVIIRERNVVLSKGTSSRPCVSASHVLRLVVVLSVVVLRAFAMLVYRIHHSTVPCSG